MNDPRQAPNRRLVAIGDVAFWVFADITGMEMETALPPEVRNKFPDEGVEAYFSWINKTPNHRRVLQANLQRWYDKHVAATLKSKSKS